MKYYALLLLLTIYPRLWADDVHLQTHWGSAPDGKVAKLAWTVSNERFSKLPKWDGKSQPSFDLNTLIEKALAYAKSKSPQPEKLYISNILIDKRLNNRWFISIRFMGGRLPGYLETVIILSDGTIIEPTMLENAEEK